ncbi:Major facilitator superfamily domain, general substrate transporter [Lasallia pustulata]|uniref:Major facilitator superfamily domain, general substrate transporter n=1 Tax=Lasallia pustulata TaxID=136370 RepID=A0A1W5D0A3_9LECA|nr:Major facilitator superfamily domain, general substrate transporter [Lasallia pustulata]
MAGKSENASGGSALTVAAVPMVEIQNALSCTDSNWVTWNGPHDAGNPRNWSKKKRWFMTLTVSCFTLLSPLSGTMLSPAIGAISADLGIHSSVEGYIVQSIFLLGIGFGPLLLGPISEIKGRKPVLLLGNLFFLIWNLGSGFAQTKNQLIAFRFLSGIGASSPLAVGGGVISDLWKPEERGRAVAVYTFGPLFGPAMGPIAGGFITQYTTWRWVFWAIAIADCALQVFAMIFLQETYGPKVLSRKAQLLRKQTGDSSLRTEHEGPDKTMSKLVRTSLSRPIILLGTQVIVQVLSLYSALLYGVMYLVLFTYPRLWVDHYHQSISIGSLNYISLAVGFILGSQIAGPINDFIYSKLKKRNHGIGTPEFRVPLLIPASFAIPVGLLWYGWSAQAKTHWIIPNIGATIFCMGTIVCFQSIQTYTIDAYTRYAASAISTQNATKSLAGFSFPLFAPAMYSALGYGWANSVLAFVSIGLGALSPLILWRYGAYLRARSTYAAGE